MSTIDLSEQESQLIEILREWSGGDAHTHRLTIERRDGAWDITLEQLSAPPGAARGTGATFDTAWDSLDPLWA